jgi:hypothetical protein
MICNTFVSCVEALYRALLIREICVPCGPNVFLFFDLPVSRRVYNISGKKVGTIPHSLNRRKRS